ncbi:MAG TPA: prolipoprotein diacylglyceryl transferase, partial [Acholeplasma sp.]|nr:prolipoprotein diacylglyceryl transferase [Acholeplasma sp.]
MDKIKIHFNKYRMGYTMGGGMVGWFILLLLMATVGQKPPYNSTALQVGSFSIAWYAVFILTGITFGAILAFYEIKFIGINKDDLYDGLLFAVPLAIVGARLYYVIFDPANTYESLGDIFDIAGGGLAIHGAVITTIIFLIFFTRFKKMNIWKVFDIIAPGFLIGQIMGRWGNFFNQEAHGGPTTRAFLKNKLHLPNFIVENMNKAGVYYHPTFLYEGLWNSLGLIIILV